MAYTLTPVLKSGNYVCDCSDSGSPYTVTTDDTSDPYDVGFRPVAIGALFYCNSRTYKVTTKAADNSIEVTYVSGSAHATWTDQSFTFLNPVITSSGTYAPLRSGLAAVTGVETDKSSSPMKMMIPTLDSNETIAMDMDGVERTLGFSFDFAPGTSEIRWSADGGTNYTSVSTLDTNLANMIDIVESLVDGQQFTATNIPTLTTTMPNRTYHIYINRAKCRYLPGEPSHVVAELELLERGM